MHIVSEKQNQIQQLKHQLFELERLQLVEKENQRLTNQLIENLKEQNSQLKKRINQIQVRQNQIQQIISLKGQFDRLREKNMELEQKRSNLSSEIYNTRLSFDHLNLWPANDLAQTHWDQHLNSSRSESLSYRSDHSSYVAPNLIDSRYISMSCLQDGNEEQSAHPKPTYGQYLEAVGWNQNKKHL